MQLSSRFSSWRELLASPPRAAHLAQWYDNDEFVGSAVAHFAAEGLRRGEAVMLRGTAQHLKAIRAHLGRRDVDVGAAIRRGQLGMADAHESLAAVASSGGFDAAVFERITAGLVEAMAVDTRFSGMRWWGEMSDLFFRGGDATASLWIEKIAERVAARRGLTMMCSFRCDRFDASAYGGVMAHVCRTHSHVVPAENYARHRIAVNRAVTEEVGGISDSLLRSIAAWKGHACDLPSSQMILLWLHETLPDKFEAVLRRARAHHAQQGDPL